MNRQCNQCNETYKDYGQKRPICRPCKQEYDRNYHNNRSKEAKEKKKQLQANRLISNRHYLYNYYLNNPCVECGEDRVATLQLDHLDKETKIKAVSLMMDHSLDKIKAEILKCRVLCANCHAVHTAEQQSWYKNII